MVNNPTNPVRAARLRAGLTGQQLADRLGITSAGVSRIETGASRPSVPMLYALATVLDLGDLANSLRPYVDAKPVGPAQ